MKPLNFDNSPCSPTSSNCVIWGGPDLPCINLCKGDTITDVVEKIALELCTVLDTLNISAYDLTCFSLANCSPQTFTDLINFLIVKVCALENGTPSGGGTTPSGGCPTDCFVEVAPCFVVGTATVMNLTNYVTTIGERICDLVDSIAAQQLEINDLEVRVTELENYTPPSYTTPTMVMGCQIDTLAIYTTQGIDTVIRAFINNVWCSYVSITGSAGLLSTAVSNQTVAATDMSKVNPAAQMSVQYAGLWTTPTVTIAGTINNIWACIKDLRNQTPVTVAALDTATINMTVTGGPTYVVSADVIPSAPSIADTATVNLSVGAGPTYTLTADVIVPGAMSASSTPSNLPVETPSSSINLIGDGVVQLLTELYDEDSAYNPATGIWSCPATGRYDLNFYVHISKPGIGFTSGMVIAGIVSSTSAGYYVASSATLNQVTKFIDITGSALGINLTVGAQLQLNILNLSDVAYTATAGDVARFSIQKVK
jgi:hypothetical protein